MVAIKEKFIGSDGSHHAKIGSGEINYYWGRAINATPDYFEDVGDNPLRPLGLIGNYADAFSRTTTDLLRMVQRPEDRRRIRSLGERGRFVDSVLGAGEDAIGATGSLLRLDLWGALTKGTSSFLAVGDIAIGGAADLADIAVGADIKHKRLAHMQQNAYKQLQANTRGEFS